MEGLTRRIVLAGMMTMALPRALHAGDTNAEAVIESQLKAFRADDGNAAYDLAAPAIRRAFPTSDAFMAMVARGYGAIRKPSQWAFGRFRSVSGGSVLQEIFVTGPEGKGWRAIYQLERQPDGRWLIAGVSLEEADLPSI